MNLINRAIGQNPPAASAPCRRLRSTPLIFCLALLALFFPWHPVRAQIVVATPPDAAAEPAKAGTVSGRFITEDGGEMAGGNVMLYNAGTTLPPRFSRYTRVPSMTAVIASDGTFQAELPAGEYYLFAIKKKSGSRFGKPQKGDYLFKLRDENTTDLKKITIRQGEQTDLGVLKAAAKKDRGKAAGSRAEQSTIAGTVRDGDGKPVRNASIFAFPTPRMQNRRPLFVSAPTDADGKYTLRVAGDRTYFLMARDVLGGGKLEVGRIVGVYGGHRPVGIPAATGETVANKDITVVTVQPRGPREEFESRDPAGKPAAAIAAITGTLTDGDGNGVAGAEILVYREPGKLGPPLFSAGPSKADGSFRLTFPEEGTYYLVARAPRGNGQGMMLGRYGGEKDTPLAIRKNTEMQGIDIVLHPVGPLMNY